jgi:hypothetical protein
VGEALPVGRIFGLSISNDRGHRNRTLLREAEEEVDLARATGEVPLDSVFVIEKAMQHFYTRAEMGKNAGREQSEVDADYEKAAHLAASAAPYRHARLSAMKLAGNPVSRGVWCQSVPPSLSAN